MWRWSTGNEVRNDDGEGSSRWHGCVRALPFWWQLAGRAPADGKFQGLQPPDPGRVGIDISIGERVVLGHGRDQIRLRSVQTDPKGVDNVRSHPHMSIVYRASFPVNLTLRHESDEFTGGR